MIAELILAATVSTVAPDKVTWSDSWAKNQAVSYVHLHEPTSPDAVATVTFANELVHTGDAEFDLEFEGIKVSFLMHFDMDSEGRERLEVFPPDGYIARPRYVDVKDKESGFVDIIQWIGG